MIIHLISCPRTISTALMYAFAQCRQMMVMDEPFYGVYLALTGYHHPGKSEILQQMPHDEDRVLEQIDKISTHNHLFIKNMASHFKVLHKEKFTGFHHVFLIRNPRHIITSYSKVIDEPTIQDIGLQRQAELYRWFSRYGAYPPLVIDSNDILENPERHLRKLCDLLQIQFDPGMLYWPEGPKAYDGIWAPHWYQNVHQTTGFTRQVSSDDPLPDSLVPLYESCLPDYQFLYEKSITHPDHVAEI